MLEQTGFEIKSKDLRLRPDGSAKGDWDMGIAIDAVGISKKVDTICLISGDGDFVALVDYLKANGNRVEVLSFLNSTAEELVDAATQFYEIDSSLLIKEKSRRRRTKREGKH